MRCARSAAWSSTAGFHQGSSRKTWSAAVRFRPVPPAFSDTSITGGPSALWNAPTTAPRSRVAPSRRTKGIALPGVRLDSIEQARPLREDQRLVPVGDGVAERVEQRLDLRRRRRLLAGHERRVAGGLAQAQQRLERREDVAAVAQPIATTSARDGGADRVVDGALGGRRARTCSTASVRGGSSGATSRLRRRRTNGRMRRAQPLGRAARRPSAIGAA